MTEHHPIRESLVAIVENRYENLSLTAGEGVR